MLRLIALILMTIDHLAWLLPSVIEYNVGVIIRLFGRLAFPLFVYDCTMALRRSRNIPLYLLRLFGFGIISQAVIFFSYKKLLVSSFEGFINIFFTLGIGVVFVILLDISLAAIQSLGNLQLKGWRPLPYHNFKLARKCLIRVYHGSKLTVSLILLACSLLEILIIVLTTLVHPDYSVYGLTLFVCFHYIIYFKGSFSPALANDPELVNRLKYDYLLYLAIGNAIILALADYILPFFGFKGWFFGDTQVLVIFSAFLLPLACKDKKPSKLMSRALYFYYPVHLLLISLLNYVLLTR